MTKTLTKFEQLVDGLCPNIQLDEVDEALQVKQGKKVCKTTGFRGWKIFFMSCITKFLDSRFSRLGTETPRLSVRVLSRNRTRNRLQAKRGLRISLRTESMIL